MQLTRWLVTEERELSNGDRAHLLLPWNPPTVSITLDMLASALTALRVGIAGEPCSKSPNAVAFYGPVLDRASVPRSLHGKVVEALVQNQDAAWRKWRDPAARKTFTRLWVAGNAFQTWKE